MKRDLDAGNWVEDIYGKLRNMPNDYLSGNHEGRATSKEQDKKQPKPEIVSIGTLIDKHPTLREPIIEGVLRRGETACINAKAKSGKSWTAYGIVLSVAAGLWWLGRFLCTQGRVLLIDNELHPESLAKRIHDVAEAMHVSPEVYRGQIDVVCLRGRLLAINEMLELFDQAKGYALITIDALYRALPQGTSENDNAGMAQVFNTIDRYAERTSAAILTIHHQSKGSQSDKDVVDVGSGASSFARSVDSHLVLRQHEEPGHMVLDGALRSWAPIDPMVLKWDFPVWRPVEDMDPEKLKGKATRQEERQQDRDQEGMAEIVKGLKDGPATMRELRRRTGLSRGRCERLVDKLLADDLVVREETEMRGNATLEYCLNDRE